MSERRQPLQDQFRSTDFAQAEEIRRAAASEPPTQQLAFVRLPERQDTSGALRREEVLRAEQQREAQRREELRKHISSAITTRPVAVRPPQIQHQHSYQVVGSIRYCSRCGCAWVLVQRARHWSTSWRWEPIHE